MSETAFDNLSEAVRALERVNGLVAGQIASLREENRRAMAGKIIPLGVAKEIMDAGGISQFRGPEEYQRTFGETSVHPDSFPIHGNADDLQRHKDAGHILGFRAANLSDGTPLTMMTLDRLVQPRWTAAKKGKVFYDTAPYKDEAFACLDTPRPGWYARSPGLINGSTGKDDLAQTGILSQYVRKLFEGRDTPEVFLRAQAEFEKINPLIAELINTNWQKAAALLESLPLNGLTRRLPVDATFDEILEIDGGRENSLKASFERFPRRDSDGRLVYAGRFDRDGAIVYGSRPGYAYPNIGVSFSSSLENF